MSDRHSATMGPKSTSGEHAHFTDLDGMRGVLAVVVMLSHLGLDRRMTQWTGGGLTRGLWGMSVDFFFMLSGFVLYFALERTRPGLLAYFTKRLRRLGPLAAFATLLMVLVDPFRYSPVTVAANFAMVQTFVGRPSVDLAAWSVPPELFLPALALPLLGHLAQTGKTGGGVALAVLGLAIAFLLLRESPSAIDQIARAACGLAFGMVLARLRQRTGPGPSRPIVVLAAFGAFVVIMILGGRWPLLATAMPVAAATAIFHGARTATILSSVPLQALGRWSYAIYLLHMPVLEIVMMAIGPVAWNAWMKPFAALPTLLAAPLAYRYIERPFLQHQRWTAPEP